MMIGWNYCEIITKQVHGKEHGKPTNQRKKHMMGARHLKIHLDDGPKAWARADHVKIVV